MSDVNVINQTVNMSISWITIFVMAALGLVYVIGASLGIDIFSKCSSLKGSEVQENLNKWLIATLGIIITVPVTLLITKMFDNETPIFLILYSLLGVIGMSIALNWSSKCENKGESDEAWIGVSLTSFICALLSAFFMISSTNKE